jgi:hypothetical protein
MLRSGSLTLALHSPEDRPIRHSTSFLFSGLRSASLFGSGAIDRAAWCGGP